MTVKMKNGQMYWLKVPRQEIKRKKKGRNGQN